MPCSRGSALLLYRIYDRDILPILVMQVMVAAMTALLMFPLRIRSLRGKADL